MGEVGIKFWRSRFYDTIDAIKDSALSNALLLIRLDEL